MGSHRKKTRIKDSKMYCRLCLANCEFVTVFILCSIVLIVFLVLLIDCEMTNSYISQLQQEYNDVSQIRKNDSSGSSRNLDLSSSKPSSAPTTTQSPDPDRKFYFPLKIQADPASIATISNSIADCTMFLILVGIFGTGFITITGVGFFCCCIQTK